MHTILKMLLQTFALRHLYVHLDILERMYMKEFPFDKQSIKKAKIIMLVMLLLQQIVSSFEGNDILEVSNSSF